MTNLARNLLATFPVLRSVAAIGFCLVLFGCAPGRNRSNIPPPPPPPVEHLISYPGETLSIIARWYTGDAQNWTAIREANPGLDERKLRMGDVVIVPAGLVIKREPLPKNFGSGGTSSGSTARAATRTSRKVEPANSNNSVPSQSSPLLEEAAVGVVPQDVLPTAAPVETIFEPKVVPSELTPPNNSINIDLGAPAPKAPVDAPSLQPTAPADKRVKTRDDLLKELLDEY